jgi:hypothetical protein
MAACIRSWSCGKNRVMPEGRAPWREPVAGARFAHPPPSAGPPHSLTFSLPFRLAVAEACFFSAVPGRAGWIPHSSRSDNLLPLIAVPAPPVPGTGPCSGPLSAGLAKAPRLLTTSWRFLSESSGAQQSGSCRSSAGGSSGSARAGTGTLRASREALAHCRRAQPRRGRPTGSRLLTTSWRFLPESSGAQQKRHAPAVRLAHSPG